MPLAADHLLIRYNGRTYTWSDGLVSDVTLLDAIQTLPFDYVPLTETGPAAIPGVTTELGIRAAGVALGFEVLPEPDWDIPDGATDGPTPGIVLKHYGPGPHPGTGTEQTVHGSISPTLNGFENTMSALPEHTQEAIRQKMAEHIGTEEEVKARLRDYLDQAAAKAPEDTGLTWYEDMHRWAEAEVAMHNLPTEKIVGMAASISPGMEWEKNRRMVEMLLDHGDKPLGEYGVDMELLNEKLKAYADKYDLKYEPVEAADSIADIGEPSLAAVSFYEISKALDDPYPARYGYRSLSDAIEIFRGASPSEILPGMKVRSFYNNLLGLSNDRDVTVDVQMIGAAMGRNMEGKADKKLSSALVNTPSITVSGTKDSLGVRPLLSDWVRDLADEYSVSGPWGEILPRQAQAMIWVEFKEDLGRFGTER